MTASPLPESLENRPSFELACPSCGSANQVKAGEEQFKARGCARCLAPVDGWLFPRLYGGGEMGARNGGGEISQDGGAVCHFYPELKADTVCEECGCFLSERAAVNWSGLTYCLPCLHLLRETKASDAFLARRKLYDNMALGLVVFLAPFSLFTSPVALYYLLRYRKASRGMIPRSPFRWWLALVITIGWLALWGFLFTAWIMLIVEDMTR